MKQGYTLRIYKEDRRITRANDGNQPGWRCVGSYQFEGRADAGMEREVRELKPMYPEPQYKFEYQLTIRR